jgi:hypothetical protein
MSYQPEEPPPQNDLERLIRASAENPGLLGKLYRMLWAAELFAFIPDHPEMHGTHALENGDSFTFRVFWAREGVFRGGLHERGGGGLVEGAVMVYSAVDQPLQGWRAVVVRFAG